MLFSAISSLYKYNMQIWKASIYIYIIYIFKPQWRTVRNCGKVRASHAITLCEAHFVSIYSFTFLDSPKLIDENKYVYWVPFETNNDHFIQISYYDTIHYYWYII